MISLVEKDQRCRISNLKRIINRQDLTSGSVFFNMATMEDLKNMGKEILKLTTDVVIDIDGIEASVINGIILRFPNVAQDIFKELDNETVTKCRNVSRLWCDYLDDQKFCWVRMIQRYHTNMKNEYQQWKKVFKNTPVEFVKEISVTTQQFFKRDASRITFYWSPLHIAAGQGNLELCKRIFEKTKNIQPRFKYKWTALHVAVTQGHEEICEFLMENLEDKNPSDKNGTTSFHYAAERGLTNVCRLIIENIDDKNPAAPNGCTPLHLAAKNGHLEIVRLIVETGVDKNSLFNGKTPLDLVTKRNLTFYRLLSKDKFQLCGLMFEDLWVCLPFWVCLFVVMIPLMPWYCALTSEIDCDINRKSLAYCVGVLPIGILVTFVIIFSTISIRVIIFFLNETKI